MDPKFLQFPVSLNSDEGSQVNFSCQLEGTKPISVKWFKDNKPLVESDRVKLVSDEQSGEFSLSIPTCLSIDEGQYHATASNSNGEVTAAFSLVVSYDTSSDSNSVDVKKILEKSN